MARDDLKIRRSIAQAIKAARGGMSKTDLAKAVGVDFSTIGRWENLKNPTPPTFDKAVRLAEALGVSLVELAFGREEFYRRVAEHREPFYEVVIQEAVRRFEERQSRPRE